MNPESSESPSNFDNYEQMTFLDQNNNLVTPIDSIAPTESGEATKDSEESIESSNTENPTLPEENKITSITDKIQGVEKTENIVPWYVDKKAVNVYWIFKRQLSQTLELWPLYMKAEKENPNISYNDIKRITTKYCEVVRKKRGKNTYKWNDKFVLPDTEEPNYPDNKVYDEERGEWVTTSNSLQDRKPTRRRAISGADAYAMWLDEKEDNQE